MKTTANVQKTNLKSAFFAAGLIIIGFSVDGQGATRPNLTIDDNNQFAFANSKIVTATEKSATNNSTASFAAYDAIETEEALTLESWMTTEPAPAISGAFSETAIEEELTLEAWMTEETKVVLPESVFTVETEEPLVLEDWMTKETKIGAEEKRQATEKIYIVEIGKTKYVVREIDETEKDLVIESWMVYSQLWK